jgi:ABC-type glutathione transport system ATPase component
MRSGHYQQVLNHISLKVEAGQTYGIVGESGSGKSTLGLAVLRYLPYNGVIREGTVQLDGIDLTALKTTELRALWGSQLALIPQDPASSLNPTMTVGKQLAEVFQRHQGLANTEAYQRAIDMLDRVQIPRPADIAGCYPHQLSGGMQQRAVIGMALSTKPRLLVLDEPTTNLDVTTESAILTLIQELLIEQQAAALFITHNLGVVARVCQRVAVLNQGELVEDSETQELFNAPQHPYTIRLLEAIPRLGTRKPTPPPTLSDTALTIQSLTVQYRRGTPLDRIFRPDWRTPFRAVDQVSLTIPRGLSVGLVGESGSGKTTLARTLMGLVMPSAGEVRLGDCHLTPLRQRSVSDLKRIQMVFQQPDQSLNPYQTIGETLRQPLITLAQKSGSAVNDGVAELLQAVHLPTHYTDRYPSELSGGEKQRVAIARALAAEPEYLLCDEPISALDVSVQAEILALLAEVQSSRQVGLLFISHDLAAVGYLADVIAVMYRGEIVEVGMADGFFTNRQHHPYTEQLIAAIPTVSAA